MAVGYYAMSYTETTWNKTAPAGYKWKDLTQDLQSQIASFEKEVRKQLIKEIMKERRKRHAS